MRHYDTAATIFLTGALTVPILAFSQIRPGDSSATSRLVAPLTEAVWTGDLDQLRHLLADREDPAKEDDQGYTPWMWAIIARDSKALSMLLERVSTIAPQQHHMLLITAAQNDIAGTELLLKRGVPVDAPSKEGSGTSALLVAAASGYVELMRALLNAGANAKLQDKHGDTPLMAAVRHGSMDAIRLLLDRGAEPNQTDEANRTAMAWAARSRREDVMRLLRAHGATPESPVMRGRPISIRAAVEKSLPVLQRSAASWLKAPGCFSCHHQPMALRIAAVARTHKFGLDEANVEAQYQSTYGRPAGPRIKEMLNSPQALLRQTLNNVASPSFTGSTYLSSMIDFGVPRDPDLQWRALALARMQLTDGSWRHGGPRVPFESTDFTTTANAVRVLDAYSSPEDAQEMSARIERARSWLMAKTAVTSDEEVYRLLGLYWTKAGRRVVGQQAAALKRDQNPDGGWSQLRGMNSDAYATGLALVALHQTGELRVTDAIYRRGVEYLLSTQESDGSWLITKRAAPALPWVDTGFPHGKFQIISYIGTSWAAMALMYAAP